MRDLHGESPPVHLASRRSWPAFTLDGRWLITGDGREYIFWSTADWSAGIRIPRRSAGEVPGRVLMVPGTEMAWMASSRTELRLTRLGTLEELYSLAALEGGLASLGAWPPRNGADSAPPPGHRRGIDGRARSVANRSDPR